jgi:hypothetical protein
LKAKLRHPANSSLFLSVVFMFIRFASAPCCLLVMLGSQTSAMAAGPVSAVPDTPPSLRIPAPQGSMLSVAKPPAKTPATENQVKPSAPRFKQRVWHNTLGQPIANGKAVGISTDVIWLRTLRGTVIRKKLSELHPQDRHHALKKRQAILEFRRRSQPISS